MFAIVGKNTAGEIVVSKLATTEYEANNKLDELAYYYPELELEVNPIPTK